MMTNIRRMELRDIPQVKRIQDSHSYWDKSLEEAEREGFFLRLLSEEQILKKIMNPLSLNLVYQSQRGIEGYVLASQTGSEHKADETILSASYFDPAYLEKFKAERYVFASYVAKLKESHGAVIVKLEKEFFRSVAKVGIDHIVSTIALNPYNRRSWRFHSRSGFKQIGKMSEEINDVPVEWGLVYRYSDLKY